MRLLEFKISDFFLYLGTIGSDHTVFEHNIKRLPNDGTRIQDMDTIHSMAVLWLVYIFRFNYTYCR